MAQDENQRLSELSEEAIFAEIGFALLGDEFGSTRLTTREAARAGRSWFESVLPSIRSRICGNKLLAGQLLNDMSAARNMAIIAILEPLLKDVFANVPVLTIVHAIACYGIRRICQNADANTDAR